MSLSNPIDEVYNPANRFYEWSGKKGHLSYYDKQQEKSIEVKIPFSFILLDRMSTIGGFNDPDNCGIFSNEVRNLKKETLQVKTFKGSEIADGLYNDIQDRIKARGGKFGRSLYIAEKNEQGVLQIANIKLIGAALSNWIDLEKKFRNEKRSMYGSAYSITDTEAKKKGSIDFIVPIFKEQKLTDESRDAAIPLDQDLQKYLRVYFTKQDSEDLTANDTQGHPVHGSPANEREANVMEAHIETAKRQAGVQQDEFDGSTVEADDDDDLPF